MTDKHETQITNEGSTKEAPPWNGQQTNSTEGLNMFDGPNLSLISDEDQDKICLVRMKDP